MPSSQANPELKALVSEDSSDLLSYLLEENIPGAQEVIGVASSPQGLAAFENVVLQIARAYSICAYEESVDLELLTKRLSASLEAYPALLTVLRTYQGNVDLRAVNEDIEDDARSYQSERLEEYLGQFLPDRLA